MVNSKCLLKVWTSCFVSYWYVSTCAILSFDITNVVFVSFQFVIEHVNLVRTIIFGLVSFFTCTSIIRIFKILISTLVAALYQKCYYLSTLHHCCSYFFLHQHLFVAPNCISIFFLFMNIWKVYFHLPQSWYLVVSSTCISSSDWRLHIITSISMLIPHI